jgi:hypothetical protein
LIAVPGSRRDLSLTDDQDRRRLSRDQLLREQLRAELIAGAWDAA